MAEQLLHVGHPVLVQLAESDLCATAEPSLECDLVEAPLLVDAEVDAAAGLTGARPGSGIAEHDRAAGGHVLECESLDVCAIRDPTELVLDRSFRLPADDDVSTGEADAKA